MKYLLECEGAGAIIEMPRGMPSDYWTETQNEFVRACGHNPAKTFNNMLSIYPDCVCEGVNYHWELAGPGGAFFLLYQMPDVSNEQLERAKSKLRRERDVVRMKVLKIKRLISFTLPQPETA